MPMLNRYAQNVSIHAPHEGERPFFHRQHNPQAQFQSTLPTRGSDIPIAHMLLMQYSSFNPRSPRGGATLILFHFSHIREQVSIHAPHEGERPTWQPTATPALWFQSTLPTRGSDQTSSTSESGGGGFNPRSPRGGATMLLNLLMWKMMSFNPRSPRGGATDVIAQTGDKNDVSIHAPHEGERR